MRTLVACLALCSSTALFAQTPSPVENPLNIDDSAIASEERTDEWLAYGRTHSETRFSTLTDINTESIGSLGVDWYMDLPRAVGLIGTPLVVDGVLYFAGTMNVIRAVDATTGELLWEHDPEVAKEVEGHKQAGWVHSRGISFYGGKVLAATWDGRLRALDAKTGELLWSTRTFGLDDALYITGMPKAFKGKVLVGNGGTENGPSRGFVTAYDVETGEEAWKFHIVPGNPADGFESEAMRMAASTWTGKWWEMGGGGNAWNGFTYDEELDVLYIGTGNGAPWNRKVRSPDGGDNLFLCSIVALDPDTGEYLWHYQTTPGETWDYNSSMDIVLADLEIEGEKIKALMHAPKNGFFYVINRETGKLVSAEPYVETTWASHIDLKTGRPVELPGARYGDGEAVVTPGPFGGHNWHAMSFNPGTGLAYIPTIHHAVRYDDRSFDASWRAEKFTGGSAVEWHDEPVPQPRPYRGSLQAWDPVTQKAAWIVEQDDWWNAGTLTTAGNLVFQGRSDGLLVAYDARNGDQVWSFDLGLGISAPPITYKINGKQYVALLVGYGGGGAAKLTNRDPALGWAYGVHTRRLVAFALDSKAPLPKQPPPYYPQPLQASFEVDKTLSEQGEILFWERHCVMCHGRDVIAGGMAPDLRASPIPLSEAAFADVVRNGAKSGRAMPAFPDIGDDELLALRHYIRSKAASP